MPGEPFTVTLRADALPMHPWLRPKEYNSPRPGKERLDLIASRAYAAFRSDREVEVRPHPERNDLWYIRLTPDQSSPLVGGEILLWVVFDNKHNDSAVFPDLQPAVGALSPCGIFSVVSERNRAVAQGHSGDTPRTVTLSTGGVCVCIPGLSSRGGHVNDWSVARTGQPKQQGYLGEHGSITEAAGQSFKIQRIRKKKSGTGQHETIVVPDLRGDGSACMIAYIRCLTSAIRNGPATFDPGEGADKWGFAKERSLETCVEAAAASRAWNRRYYPRLIALFEDGGGEDGGAEGRAMEVEATPPPPVEVEATPPPPVEVEATPPSPVEVEATPSPPMEVEATPPLPVEVEATPPLPVEVEATTPLPVEVEATPPLPVEVGATPPPPVEVEATTPPPVEVEATPPPTAVGGAEAAPAALPRGTDAGNDMGEEEKEKEQGRVERRGKRRHGAADGPRESLHDGAICWLKYSAGQKLLWWPVQLREKRAQMWLVEPFNDFEG